MTDRVDCELRKALASRDVSAVKNYLDLSTKQSYDKGFLVSKLIESRWSLRRIVFLGRVELTKILLDGHYTINLDKKDSKGRDILYWAVSNRHVGHVRLFLKFHAGPSRLNKDLDSLLSCLYSDDDSDDASEKRRVQILKMLISRGANLAAITDWNEHSALAARSILNIGHAEEVRLVLNAIVDLRRRYQDSNTVAHYLAPNKYPGVWQLMRNRDFDVNARNDGGKTPLYLAAKCGNLEAIQVLLSFENFDVSDDDGETCTPIYIATEYYVADKDRYGECIVLMLLHGADVQDAFIDRHGDESTVFHLARWKSYNHLAQIFLEHLALQEALGIQIKGLVQSKIESESRFNAYFNVCKQMLTAKVYGSETLFTLLTCNKEKLVSHMRNKSVVAIFQTYLKIIGGAVYYNRVLRYRMQKASETIKLRYLAAVVIGKLTGIDRNSYPNVMDIVVSYLNDQDLKTLLNLGL